MDHAASPSETAMHMPETDAWLRQIEQARERIRPYVERTPLVPSEPLGQAAKSRVWLKLETQQPTGAFKVRPAFHGILSHLEQARRSGVVTSSSGNFAQAVAYAARALGVNAQIVVTHGASPYKIARTEALGGTIVYCDSFEERWPTVFEIQRQTGRLVLHSYDSEETIAGDGTIGLELIDQIDTDFCVLVPISGGGLISGIACAVKGSRPGCKVIGVQSAANPSMFESRQLGRAVSVEPRPSLADALAVVQPGEQTFALTQKLVDDIVLLEEEEIARAVRFLAGEQKLIVEPGGAVGVGALLAGKVDAAGMDVVCVLSGGNIPPAKLAEILAARD